MITPCIKVCTIEKDTCTGCKRTLKEIAHWSQYTDQQRKKIMTELKQR
jgi:predicted Fe-S protein YdhL (DUF1289 family)